ncbi:Zinc finger protein 706 [Ceraceosorus bombacis]|uniref:Zinc finger protein 706 n=2 Tax=Ceraceosorus TaxID=401624 RepID=A0A0P1BDC8_9BASI|nr:DUF1909-domain-containing protein [Ceraceosorus guamensis]PWN43686.1 DUF1909-domain-containing protein [Ceraceosorus guamensis]CEH14175.1 Zinc finger protein 706 [Ceraceosorus bombacis]
MGNGNRAQQKRERNAKEAKKGPTSQLKANQASLTVQCGICKHPFMSTVRAPALMEHINGKHPGKDIKTCFPTFSAA